MPKKYGIKEKDLVVSHVVNMVLTGKLRSGDRLDRNEIAQELGLSRVPIQEAVIQLEHDGILSTQYHRGAYVERFDEHARHFRSIINTKYAGPRLGAAIASSQTLVPPAFWAKYLQHHDALLPSYEAELTAIQAGEPEPARAACIQRSEIMARILLSELVRRGVLPALRSV
ncbi:MAG: GntR family transcriptional regulator [Mycobacterium sp.]